MNIVQPRPARRSGGEWPVLFLWPLALAHVFPDGRLPAGRWRLLSALAAVSATGVVTLLFLAPELDGPYGRVPTPLPFELDEETFLPVFWVCWVGLLVSLFGGAAILRARFRASGPERRRQILWLAYGALPVPLWLGGGFALSALIGPVFGVLDAIAPVNFQLWPTVAVAVAVTRQGLYAIDRLLHRTLVYFVLTVLLAGTYALAALLAGSVVGGSALTASVATLAVALAFRPLRELSSPDQTPARGGCVGVRRPAWLAGLASSLLHARLGRRHRRATAAISIAITSRSAARLTAPTETATVGAAAVVRRRDWTP